ncbi:hypothetical protein [Thermicanus aegyptius]|uniref:hypothetical protein n=1 Tax=Thermicanus aegyptius TaxID=94009 RepID=UPI0003FB79D8|nr:hypothetical protein [Thermicanus aegyptius]
MIIKSVPFPNKTTEEIKYVGKITQLNEFWDKLIRELNVYQDGLNVCPITDKDINKIIKIIRENQNGHLTIYGKCDNGQNLIKMRADIWFVRRKERFAVKAFLNSKGGWPTRVSRNQYHLNRKIIFTVENSNFWDSNFWDVMMDMLGANRANKIRDYLIFRWKRETLFKAAKSGIDISELKKSLKIKRRIKGIPLLDGIKFVDFKEPCLLLIGFNGPPERLILYTPFGNFESKNRIYDARAAFRDLTGARRVPYGKDAMKKIEALLIQASI